MLNSTKSNKEILSLVKEKFEGCKTSESSVAWYRSDLRKKGLLKDDKKQKFSITLSEEEKAELLK
jgi:hypothetical protein